MEVKLIERFSPLLRFTIEPRVEIEHPLYPDAKTIVGTTVTGAMGTSPTTYCQALSSKHLGIGLPPKRPSISPSQVERLVVREPRIMACFSLADGQMNPAERVDAVRHSKPRAVTLRQNGPCIKAAIAVLFAGAVQNCLKH